MVKFKNVFTIYTLDPSLIGKDDFLQMILGWKQEPRSKAIKFQTKTKVNTVMWLFAEDFASNVHDRRLFKEYITKEFAQNEN